MRILQVHVIHMKFLHSKCKIIQQCTVVTIFTVDMRLILSPLLNTHTYYYFKIWKSASKDRRSDRTKPRLHISYMHLLLSCYPCVVRTNTLCRYQLDHYFLRCQVFHLSHGSSAHESSFDHLAALKTWGCRPLNSGWNPESKYPLAPVAGTSKTLTGTMMREIFSTRPKTAVVANRSPDPPHHSPLAHLK